MHMSHTDLIQFLYTQVLVGATLLMGAACTNDPVDLASGCSAEGLLSQFKNEEQTEFFIYENGKAYTEEQGICTFVVQIFDPDFKQTNYIEKDGDWYLTNGNEILRTKSEYFEDFEANSSFSDLFIRSAMDTALYWDVFTLQSPSTPEVSEYVALRKCILNGTCDFIDHRIQLVPDPVDPNNTVVQMNSLDPAADMITCKTSISSSLGFFEKGDDLWFEGRFYFVEGMPFSLVDFENAYFEQHPGPRVVIRQGQLAVENKFADKINYDNTSDKTLPAAQWFTLKVHLKFSDTTDGIIQVWQDGVPVLNTTGINLPTYHSIQNILEIGITATSQACILLVDDIRISNLAF